MHRSKIKSGGDVRRKKTTSPALTVRLVGQSTPTITQALILEHEILRQIFDQIESVLSRSQSARVVKSLALVVEGLLSKHGKIEINLVYSVLDHVLAERNASKDLYQHHEELDGHFARIHRTSGPAKASSLLKKALTATREHFRREEQIVFPTLEEILRPETLWTLGDQWRKAISSS
jgi:hemerythrin-like domain-containing protein